MSVMSYEWQGERLYMAGFNASTERFELWRVPVVYVEGLLRVYSMSESVQNVSSLVVDSFRRGLVCNVHLCVYMYSSIVVAEH